MCTNYESAQDEEEQIKSKFGLFFFIADRMLHAAQVNTAHKNPSRVEKINTESTKEG